MCHRGKVSFEKLREHSTCYVAQILVSLYEFHGRSRVDEDLQRKKARNIDKLKVDLTAVKIELAYTKPDSLAKDTELDTLNIKNANLSKKRQDFEIELNQTLSCVTSYKKDAAEKAYEEAYTDYVPVLKNEGNSAYLKASRECSFGCRHSQGLSFVGTRSPFFSCS
ncbi:uncharacterized protein LOC120009909 [Tripterygium wilfordii]|uniref:uncharacterized protein LOC120009909 n=1 Tax=Tripterygium wilfordii TaxID=458696 RepID=UPI0018F7F6F9|nr:uncharacterized protein LOC120009909 [Tripterygium wilfordii]XP_038716568.1 uncharacterized protein LOC120009909 [Tripterygium wilfordii]